MKHLKKYKKLLLSLLFLAFCSLVFIYQSLLQYGYMQAKGQLRILWNTEPIADLLKNPNCPDSVKQKLQLIQEIRSYTEDSLGLNPSKNYTTFYDQKGKAILWNVTAALPYSLTPYEWEFPLLGTFSYKGFFEKEKANEELQKLKALGWDTDIYAVSGWSTLGFFKDPVLSAWLNYSEGRLVNLIIHELTHGTLYVKNSVEYNENLANFVGDEGAKRFLTAKYGKQSAQIQAYLQSQTDEQTFRSFVLQEAKKLDSIYKHLPLQLPESQKQNYKQAFMKEFIANLQAQHFYNQRYCHYFDEETPNNTFFMSYLRYNSKQSEFKKEFQTKFGGDFKKYMQYLKQTYRHSL